MGRSGKIVRCSGSNEAQSGAALFESCGSVYGGRAPRRSAGSAGSGTEICAPRYPAHDREKPIGAAQDAGVFVLIAAASGESAAWQTAASGASGIRTSLILCGHKFRLA